MSLMESNQLALGTSLPSFSLLEPKTGKNVRSEDYSGRPLLVVVLCNHCPYVVRIKAGLVELGRKLGAQGVQMVGVSGNDPTTHPGDGPQKMAEEATSWGYPFPYLFDEEQSLCRALHAMCTPEFYLFDAEGKLVYRGQMDGARPNNDDPNDGRDILAAVAALFAGKPPLEPQLPSRGCSIKWRAGAEPDYVRA